VKVVKSTFVVRFKSGVTRQERTSQAATIHSQTVTSNYKKTAKLNV